MNTKATIDSPFELPLYLLQGLEKLAADARAIFDVPESPDPRPDVVNISAPANLKRLKHYLKMRRLREEILPESLFADPAWDMLLDLYVAQAEGRRIHISSACIGATVPPTTGLRWIGRLEHEGLLERFPDPQDKRRTHVALTTAAIGAIERWARSALFNTS